MFKHLIEWYTNALSSGGYPLIALLMAAESSVLPLPSEVVIPPAAHLAHTGQIPLSVAGIVIAGTIGSWLGATLMYWAARLAGRPLFMRYGRLMLVTPEKIEGAESWTKHYGSMGIFISRLLPVVRHLIGIPAGVVRMNYKLFSLFTILGSGIWCSVLCYVGIKAGQDEQLMKGELRHLTIWIGGAVLVLGGLYYFFVHRQMSKKA
ncbi:MAG TPA: DedA family protein [Verrucomicrobiae bacterium]|jgi:membrane protein DedA with SNARE-associated domain